MESRYSVEDIANYFLSKGEKFGKRSITPLKIQKLVYYAQGFYLALFNKPLFNEKIEAWQHGPVCRILYNKYKKYSYHIISEPIDCNSKHRHWGRPAHSVKLRESSCTPIPPFAGEETGSSPFHSEGLGNSCSSSDASPGTKNSGEGKEEMGTTARPAEL